MNFKRIIKEFEKMKEINLKNHKTEEYKNKYNNIIN